VDNNVTTTAARRLKVTIPKQQQQQQLAHSNRDPLTHANRDTPMYSPALQFKQSNDESKRKASVRSAMKEISDMLSPVNESLSSDFFYHADAVMNHDCGDESLKNKNNDKTDYEYDSHHHHHHEMFDNNNDEDMMMMMSMRQEGDCYTHPYTDPLLALCEAADTRRERHDAPEHELETWGQHNSNMCDDECQDWVLFGGAVRVSNPTPVQSTTSSLSLRSDGVSPALFFTRNDDGSSGMQMAPAPAPAATDHYSNLIPAESNRYGQCGQQYSNSYSSSSTSNHVASIFPGLLPPPPDQWRNANEDSRLLSASVDGKSDVFSDRGETMEALCHFLFSS